MVRHLGSALTDVTYVFDEPSVGLHPHDVHRMNELLVALRAKGNTVLVVEHKPEVIEIADHIIDMGPGAGGAGGSVVYAGDLAGLRTSGTLTGNHLTSHQPLKTDVRSADRRAVVAERHAAQPAGRVRRHPARRPHRRHGRGGLRQELADPRGPAQAVPGHRRGRPGHHARLPTVQLGHVHRHARHHPQAVRQGQRRQARPVQRQLRGRLPRVRRARASSTPTWATSSR